MSTTSNPETQQDFKRDVGIGLSLSALRAGLSDLERIISSDSSKSLTRVQVAELSSVLSRLVNIIVSQTLLLRGTSSPDTTSS